MQEENNYKTVYFSDIAEQVSCRVTPKKGDEKRFIGLQDIKPGKLWVSSWGDDVELSTQAFQVKQGDIIYPRRNTYLRRVAISPIDGLCSADAMVVRPKEGDIISEFLPFFMSSSQFMNKALSLSAGSLSSRVKWKDLEKQQFQIPSIEVQEQYTKLLSKLLERDEYVEKLSESGELLQQVLMIEKLYKTSSNFEPLDKICQIIDPNPSHRYPETLKEGIALLSTENFIGKNSYSYEKAKYVNEKVYLEQLKRCKYEPDDIVFARKGRIGFARFYGMGQKCFSHTIAILKANKEKVFPDYLLLLLRSKKTLKNIENLMNSNSGVPTLGLKTLAEVHLPLPSLSVQRDIVESIGAIENINNLTTEGTHTLGNIKRNLLNVG
ncbi:restriction endonuclease subunit S [Alteromonas stellipolaris]|uniref:restriction endonuclease subunit S n=1 Tax=Alteromonas stellipolaris TaxID=233316 RepID=UPI0026E252DD|nr:restriction endonuclease subunit S [Alteromonas stellipolaris]MDO6533856.1 restriction endonuclease subunit S [Alteromonas stellipolaris]MDO6626250.1 restriction endonuclease subunit S [Alteromonas stellipolaris]